MTMGRIGALAVIAASFLAAPACANPRAVTKITGSVDEVKLVYQSRTEAGIIECSRNAEGALENCKELPVVFLPKNGGK